MATVYILYSQSLDKYYIGSCIEVAERLDQHLSKFFPGAFTSKANDWVIFFSLIDLSYKQARSIESHIKNMKSKKYIQNLKRYSEISQNLKNLYDE